MLVVGGTRGKVGGATSVTLYLGYIPIVQKSDDSKHISPLYQDKPKALSQFKNTRLSKSLKEGIEQASK